MTDPDTLCLGKLPARPNAIKFKLATYTDFSALPPIPKDFGHEEYTPPIPWGMLGNNQYGDCVVAGGAHEHMLWAKMGGKNLTFNTSDVLKDFQAITGQPPSANTGADMQQAASYRLHTGLLGADGKRHKIAAYLEIAPGSVRELYAAMYLFGACGIGFKFPNTAFDQFRNRQSWHIVSNMIFDGSGHYVPAFASRSNIVCVSWGRFQAMRPSFYASLCDEAVAYVSQEALVAGHSPEGFDYAALLADLRALHG
jgi:hypothetical protein